MKNLEAKLTKAFAVYESILSVSWWTLSEDDQEIHAYELKKATDAIEELQRRIAATRDVRRMAAAMKANTHF